MPNRDDPRGRSGPFRNEFERQAWRREAEGHKPEPGWPERYWRERRVFDEPGPYGGRGPSRPPPERERGGERHMREDDPRHGGQEYGLEGGRNHGYRGGYAFDPSLARSRNFDHDDPGVGQGQAGYGPQARSHDDPEFDPDYLRWRDQQLRAHDRDYAEWRRHQQGQYDEQYRQFRAERREQFGRAFHDWRTQRSAAGGKPDTTVAPGVSGYGDRTGIPGAATPSFGAAKPSGRIEPPGRISGDPAMTQTERQTGQSSAQGSTTTRAVGGSQTPGFGKEPPQVQASADGEREKQRKDDKPPRH
jgi:hypothetical protein